MGGKNTVNTFDIVTSLICAQHKPYTGSVWITISGILCWNGILTIVTTLAGAQFYTGHAVLAAGACGSTTKIPLAAGAEHILHHFWSWQPFIVHWYKLVPLSFPSIFQWGSMIRFGNMGGNPDPRLPWWSSNMLFETIFTGWKLC